MGGTIEVLWAAFYWTPGLVRTPGTSPVQQLALIKGTASQDFLSG
jgi:hypothetical protein